MISTDKKQATNKKQQSNNNNKQAKQYLDALRLRFRGMSKSQFKDWSGK